MTQPFAWLAFLLLTVRILTSERLPAGREKKVVADLDVHFGDLDCAGRVVWYVEFNIERSHLLELQIINDNTVAIRQRQVQVLCHLTLYVFQLPYYFAFSCIVLGYAILLLEWIQLLFSSLGRARCGMTIVVEDVLAE